MLPRPPRRAHTPSSRNGPLAFPSADLLALLESKDLERLIDVALPLLQQVGAGDFASAFYRSTPDGLLKERDSRGISYSPAFLHRYVELTPAIPLARANRGVRMLTTREAIRGSESVIQASAFYREIMQPQGWRHAVALCFWADPPSELPVFVLSVLRVQGRADFTRADLGRLDAVYPFIACAVHRLQEQEKIRSVLDGMALTGRDGNRGLALLDAQLRLVEANPLARRLAAAWQGTASGGRHHPRAVWLLPRQLENACHAMRREWNALLQANPDARSRRKRRCIRHARVDGLGATITMACRNTTSLSEPSFVLEFERRAASAPRPRRAAGSVLQMLTAAERAVVLVLTEGLTNQEIADRLNKSVDAVKFLLHRAYQKTGVSSRGALVAALRATVPSTS